MKRVIATKKAPGAIGPYQQAICVDNMLFSSGQLGINPETGELEEGIEAQTKRSLSNIQAILEEAGFTKEDIVKTTCFLADMADFGAMNTLYQEYFGESYPARSAVAVKTLPKGGLVEIEFVAVKTDK